MTAPSERLFALVTGPGEDTYRAVDLLDIAHAMVDVEFAGNTLLSVLPDSPHEGEDWWGNCWQELTSDAQDQVKKARRAWLDCFEANDISLLRKIARAAMRQRWMDNHSGGPHFTSAPSEYAAKEQAANALDAALVEAGYDWRVGEHEEGRRMAVHDWHLDPIQLDGNAEPYLCTIVTARYGGGYEGTKWLAFPWFADELPEGWDGGDNTAEEFWKNYRGPCGKGGSPQDAYSDLLVQLRSAYGRSG